MLRKIIAGMVLLASLSFGMSLAKLNGASKAELMEINGIGEVKASEIIKQRRKGKFKSFADLQERVVGVGEQTVDNLKRDVKVADDVKKVKKTTKKKVTKKRKTTKTKAEEKKKKIKTKTKKKMTKSKVEKPKKKIRKVKSTEEKKKELKKKPRKTKTKKTKTKKTRKTKTKN